jgi:hypothetical protein
MLLLPLVADLLDRGLEDPGCHTSDLKALLVIAVFMVIDMAARLGIVGPWLRDAGLPLLSVVGMIAVGAMILRERDWLRPRSITSQPVESKRDVPEQACEGKFILS